MLGNKCLGTVIFTDFLNKPVPRIFVTTEQTIKRMAENGSDEAIALLISRCHWPRWQCWKFVHWHRPGRFRLSPPYCCSSYIWILASFC